MVGDRLSIADLGACGRNICGLLVQLAGNLVYHIFDGATARSFFSGRILDRSVGYVGNNDCIDICCYVLFSCEEAGTENRYMGMHQFVATVCDDPIFSKYQIRDFLVEWNSSLYYSVWAGNDGSLWDVPVSRYGKKTLFYICLYQYVLSGRFQLSGTAVCVNCFRIYGYFSEK